MSQNKRNRLLALAAFMLSIALPACVAKEQATPTPTPPPSQLGPPIRLRFAFGW